MSTTARSQKSASTDVDHTLPRLHPPARLPLTDRQSEVYAFIREHIEQQGYPPTVREIGVHFEINSPNGVACHLKALVAKGYIERSPRQSRAIKLEDMPNVSKQGVVKSHGRKVRFLGRVSAGGLVEAVGWCEEWDLEDLYSAADSFVLLEGSELEQRLHLKDGDQLLFREGRCVGMVRLIR